MNKRWRQRLRAEHMLDKYDPPVIASVPVGDGPWRKALIFRRSELESMKQQYGDALKILTNEDVPFVL